VPAAPSDPSLHVVAARATLRRLPSEQAQATVEGSRSPVANAIAILHRGDRVALIERSGHWTRVRASGGAEGWVRGAALIPGDAVQEGTLLVAAWAYDRPDLLTVNAKRKLEPGTLLFIRKTRDLFSEVDAGAGPSVWVLTDRISVRPGDVEDARLVEKARYLARGDRREEAREVLALLRSRSPESPLVPVLAAELGEAPPDAGAPPGGGAAGSAPGAEARSPP
jgi:SH3-like domain-containing protein